MTGPLQKLPLSDTWTVANVFSYSPQRLYRVPPYQRGYAWTEEQVKSLLTDLWEAFTRAPDDYYLLGQIILAADQHSSWLDVIDGQQRLTTLYLILAAAKRRIEEGGELAPAKKALMPLVDFYLSYHDLERNSLMPRFVPAVSIRAHLDKILSGAALPNSENLSEENLEQAFDDITEYLNAVDPNVVFDYLWFIINNAVMLSLTLESTGQAIQVFARINNRGLTLDDADLLKNLLFEKVSNEDDFQKLSEHWEKASKNLYDSKLKRVKSMEFLMKALIGIETGNSIRTDDVFKEWQLRLKTEKLAKDFAQSLPGKAKCLANISNGKTPSGHATEVTAGSHLFKWVQHLQVLLAGSHLSEQSYADLARVVEARVMLSLFSSEKNQDFERLIHQWSKDVSNLDQYASRDEILRASASVLKKDAIRTRIEDLEKQLSLLSYSRKTQRVKMRYVLARCAMAVQFRYVNDHASNANSVVNFMKTTSGKGTSQVPGYDLDHIYPKAPDIDNEGLWDRQSELDTVDLIGNLTLLHPSDNRSQNNILPWNDVKVKNFAGSGLIMNRLLVGKDQLGSLSQKIETEVDRLQAMFPLSLSNWNPDQVRERGRFYFELFRDELLSDLGFDSILEFNASEDADSEVS